MEAQGALFVVGGKLTLSLNGTEHVLRPGGFAYLPPASRWSVHSSEAVQFHWISEAVSARAWDRDAGGHRNEPENSIAPTPMPHTDRRWATTRFVDPSDIRHDMHITIVTFEPGASNSVRGDPRHGARSLCS